MIDKAVDSAALDSALTDIADAIRTKTGGTDPLTLEQMPGEIANIEAGSGEVDENWKYANKISFTNAKLPDTFEVTLPPNQTDFSSVFGRNSITKHIIVHSEAQPTSMAYMFTQVSEGGIYTITLDFDTSKVTTYQSCFSLGYGAWGAKFTAINGVIDFSSVTTTAGANSVFVATNNLKEVTFAANTLGVSFNASTILNINDASLLSLLNCLKDRTGEDALTLTVADAWKTEETGRLYVTYVKLDADTGLYVLCEQTDEGAMTIADAITAKNRTIA